MWQSNYYASGIEESEPEQKSITINNVEEYEAQLMLRAERMALAIEDFRNHLRSMDKHGNFETEEASNVVEKLFVEYCNIVVAEVPYD